MNLGIKIYAVFTTLCLTVIIFAYLLHRKEVKTLSKKIKGLLERSTHTEITTDFPSADVVELVNSLNELFEVYREQINELQKKDDTIKETITNLAHDLRTPLTAIQGYAQMLLQSPDLTKEDLEAVKIIKERLTLLNQLLNQLFLYARLETEVLEFNQEQLDINTILRSVLVSFYQAFESKGIEPRLSISEEPFIIIGDKNALVRIFSNIISNALAHGNGDYAVTSQKEVTRYLLKFSNRTSDIEISDMDRIFERFYTTDKSRSKKTTGLGLAISRKLIEQMGGEINADLENSTFTINVYFPYKSIN